MAQLVNSTQVDIWVQYHLFSLGDQDSDEEDPEPGELCSWAGAGTSAIVFQSEEDIIRALLRLELWDGAAPVDCDTWPATICVELTLPSGVLGVAEMTLGAVPAVFTAPPGSYNARLGWRESLSREDGDDVDIPIEGFALVQLWPRV